MLNEELDECLKKSHSQFEPSSEDAFGDSPSDINLDSINFGNKVCIGGVCGGDVLAYGKNTKEKFSDKPGSTENTEHLKNKPTIEVIARPVIGNKMHMFTIFTYSDGRKEIIAGCLENHDFVTGNLQAVDIVYTPNNRKLLGDDFPIQGDYKTNKKFIKIMEPILLNNNQELNSYLSKARGAVNFIETGNNGGRFDYDICTTDKCWGANSNTVQRVVHEAMGTITELRDGIKKHSDISFPGIDGKFYKGIGDDIMINLGEVPPI